MRLTIAAAALSLLFAAPAVHAAPLAPVADGPALAKASTIEAATTHKKKKAAKRKPASSTQQPAGHRTHRA